jgi:acylphosphatase
MSVCFLCRVSGRVQGVFFRASTQREAQQLGLTGHAHNLTDGSVEVLVCGDAAAVQQLQAWLWQGPPAARVSNVECRRVEGPAPAHFRTG